MRVWRRLDRMRTGLSAPTRHLRRSVRTEASASTTFLKPSPSVPRLTAEEAADDDGDNEGLNKEADRRLDGGDDDIEAAHHQIGGAYTAAVEGEETSEEG